MHSHLKHNYQGESGGSIDSCVRVQEYIAGLLRAESRPCQKHIVWGEEFATLIPTPYKGMVKWGAHYVCSSEGIVLDPMLPEPLPMDEYLSTAYSQPVKVDDY